MQISTGLTCGLAAVCTRTRFLTSFIPNNKTGRAVSMCMCPCSGNRVFCLDLPGLNWDIRPRYSRDVRGRRLPLEEREARPEEWRHELSHAAGIRVIERSQSRRRSQKSSCCWGLSAAADSEAAAHASASALHGG